MLGIGSLSIRIFDRMPWRRRPGNPAVDQRTNAPNQGVDWRIETHALAFGDGSSWRPVTLFLPNALADTPSVAVCFCADGQAVPDFARSLRHAVQAGQCPPTILVGVHSVQSKRGEEYLLGADDGAFDAHQAFFVQNLPDWLRSTFEIEVRVERTAVFGFSNGGAFAMAMGLRHPDKFGVVVGFSVARCKCRALIPPPNSPWIPRYYLSAGNRGPEKMFQKHTASLAGQMRRRGIEHVFTQRDAGHEIAFWATELPRALEWAFRRDGRGLMRDDRTPKPEGNR